MLFKQNLLLNEPSATQVYYHLKFLNPKEVPKMYICRPNHQSYSDESEIIMTHATVRFNYLPLTMQGKSGLLFTRRNNLLTSILCGFGSSLVHLPFTSVAKFQLLDVLLFDYQFTYAPYVDELFLISPLVNTCYFRF